MAFQVSPGVAVSEVDLSTTIPSASVSDAGFVGFFNKGPVNQIVNISSENDLVKIFGKPQSTTNKNNVADWLTISSFLAYGGDIQVVRMAGGAVNSSISGGALIENDADWEVESSTQAASVVARTAGAWGNDLRVLIFGETSGWATVDASTLVVTPDQYDLPTIPDATSNTDIHVLVGIKTGVDSSDKEIIEIVETHLWLSITAGSTDESGNNNHFAHVLNNKSAYVYAGATAIGIAEVQTSDGFQKFTFIGGEDGTFTSTASSKDYDLFEDTEQVDLSLVVSGAFNQDEAVTLATLRKDCVAFVSPDSDAVNTSSSQSGKCDAVVGDKPNLLNSYGFMDSGWKKMYDKYNDTWVNVPLNGDIAGLCVATDNNRDPWYSPAGFNRGQIRNCAGLLFDPNKSSRDTLYKNNVNPVASFPGEGYVLFGDKTLQTKPSAFDRLNVRRLFIVIEKAISSASKYSLFEFNDEFTRGQFRSMVDPFLRDIKARRGIYDYLLVCDDSNNTPEIIDKNEFVGDIFIKPARSINFIQLNFVAVKTGVSFSEIVGAI